MKRRIGANAYNRRLLIVLIIITVAISLAAVVIGVVAAYEKNDDGEKSNGNKVETAIDKDDKNEEKNAEKGKKDESSDENEDNVSSEKTEKNEEKDGKSDKSENEDKSETKKETPKQPADSGATSGDDWMLILANPWNKIPEDFTVELEEIGSGHKVDKRIVADLNEMMADLRKDGHSAFVCSSYRTNAKQTTLYNNEISDYLSRGYSKEEAVIEAGKWVAIPGTSEHQTGLAVDIMSSHYMVLDKGQEDTAEQKWLMENSWKYGFILRYPSDKSDLTGIYYEPWHYRYVGKDAAKEIYDRGICFEEYLAG